jgi:hypothetical protein
MCVKVVPFSGKEIKLDLEVEAGNLQKSAFNVAAGAQNRSAIF